MPTYNTGNPIPSADPRDLNDNAQNIDEWAISQDKLTHPDRLGVERKTWHGMEEEFDASQVARESEFDASQADKAQRFNQLLAASGYVFLADYAAGIEITEYNEVIRDGSGNLWRAASTTTLPYTTDGTGLPESGAFVSAGDAVLRNDLMDSLANGQGALNVRGSVIYVDTIADLQALPTSGLVDGQAAEVTSDGSNNGIYKWDISAAAWKPNGYRHQSAPAILDSQSVSAKLSRNIADVEDFGARTDEASSGFDSSQAWQDACDAIQNDSPGGRGRILVGSGTFNLSGVEINSAIRLIGTGIRSTTLKPSTTGSILHYRGQLFGAENIRFEHDRSFDATAIDIEDAAGATAASAIQKWLQFRDLFIIGFKGAGLIARNAVWETEFMRVHTRECGDSVQDLCPFDFRNPETNSDETNNILFYGCKAIFPQYIGARFGHPGDGASAGQMRKIKWLHGMLHGGTNDGDLTPAPYDMMQFNRFSRVGLISNNITHVAANQRAVYAKGEVGSRSVLLSAYDNEIEGADADGNGIWCESVANINIMPNKFTNMGNGSHINFDSDCVRTNIAKQDVQGGLPVNITNNASEKTGYVDDEKMVLSQLQLDKGLNGSNNLSGEVSVSGESFVTVTLPRDESNAGYQVFPSTNFDAGGAYISNKTATDFRINFPTTGTGVAWWFISR